MERARGGLLKDVWILSHKYFIDWREGDNTNLLWISGGAGKGKTMLLIGVVRTLQDSLKSTEAESNIRSHFFCRATDSDFNKATAVLRGLIGQIVEQHRPLVSHLREDHDKTGRSPFEGPNAFTALSRIFKEMLGDPGLTARVYLVVDALDECEPDDFPELLDLIIESASSARVKWLVSSRNRSDIETKLKKKAALVELSLEENSDFVSQAVNTYIDYKVSNLAEAKRYDSALQKHVNDELRRKANGTFLWVALVCEELGKLERWDARKLLNEVPSDLTKLYAGMMDRIERLQGLTPEFCKTVLSISTLAYRPLHLSELTALADWPKDISFEKEDLKKIIFTCGSFLTIQGDNIYFIHQTAKEYLSGNPVIFSKGEKEVHHTIVLRSLDEMEKLHKDMYNLRDPGISIDEDKPLPPDPLAQVRYACVHWIDHLCEIASSSYDQVGLYDNGKIHKFLKEHFLHWMEALSLTRSMSNGVVTIRKLEDLLAVRFNESRLLDLVRDELRFMLHNRWIIENAPLQAYASALIFSPVCSLTREQWKKEEPEWIITKPIMDSNWSPCLQTLEGHGNEVTSVAFSHDSKQLASASYDSTVKIWDAKTGECVQTLKGHWDGVTFPHDSQQGTASVAADENQERQLSGYGCNSNVSWITWNRENVLWLPTECRYGKVAVSGSTVAIGCRSGRVLVIHFSPTLSPLEMYHDK